MLEEMQMKAHMEGGKDTLQSRMAAALVSLKNISNKFLMLFELWPPEGWPGAKNEKRAGI